MLRNFVLSVVVVVVAYLILEENMAFLLRRKQELLTNYRLLDLKIVPPKLQKTLLRP